MNLYFGPAALHYIINNILSYLILYSGYMNSAIIIREMFKLVTRKSFQNGMTSLKVSVTMDNVVLTNQVATPVD